MYYLIYALVWLIMWLPMPILYLFSDFFFVIIYFIVGYRKKIVRENLKNSFPEKTEKERRRIELLFYRYFCDIFIETLAQIHISDAEIQRRFEFVNMDLILNQFAKGKSVMIMTAHYGNWELTNSVALQFPKGIKIYGIYKQLRNQSFDKFMLQLRSSYSARTIEKGSLLRAMVKKRSEGEIAAYGMISDQTPSAAKIRLWIPFLHQDTPTMLGTEELAKKFDYPVVFARLTRKKRGYYKCEMLPISMNPQLETDTEITKTYMRLLEETITKEPQYWLWTHKRWKHKRTN